MTMRGALIGASVGAAFSYATTSEGDGFFDVLRFSLVAGPFTAIGAAVGYVLV